MSPRANVNAIPGEDRGSDVQQLEMIVLGQIRDSMALMNTNLSKLSDRLEDTHGHVISLKAADYDKKIAKLESDGVLDLARCEANLQRQVDANKVNIEQLFTRANNLAVQSARLGLGMAIASTVAGTALGAVVVSIITKVLGGHP